MFSNKRFEMKPAIFSERKLKCSITLLTVYRVFFHAYDDHNLISSPRLFSELSSSCSGYAIPIASLVIVSITFMLLGLLAHEDLCYDGPG